MKKYQTAKELLATKAENKEKKPIYATRKLSIGLVSCMLGLVMAAPIARAEELTPAPGVEAAGQQEAPAKVEEAPAKAEEDLLTEEEIKEIKDRALNLGDNKYVFTSYRVDELKERLRKIKAENPDNFAQLKKEAIDKAIIEFIPASRGEEREIKTLVAPSITGTLEAGDKSISVKFDKNKDAVTINKLDGDFYAYVNVNGIDNIIKLKYITRSFNIKLTTGLKVDKQVSVKIVVTEKNNNRKILGESPYSNKVTVAKKPDPMDQTYKDIVIPKTTVYVNSNAGGTADYEIKKAIIAANKNIEAYKNIGDDLKKVTYKAATQKATLKFRDKKELEIDVSSITVADVVASKDAVVNKVTVGDTTITGKLDPYIPGTKVNIYLTDGEVKPNDAIQITVDNEGNFTYQVPADKQDKIGKVLKGFKIETIEPGPGKKESVKLHRVQPKAPDKTDVRDPKNLTETEKGEIEKKIRDKNSSNDQSLLPDGTGFNTGKSARIIFENGNVIIKDATSDKLFSDPIKIADIVNDIKPDPPTITADDDKLTFAPKSIDTDAKTITINYYDPQGTKKTATITKNDGTWTSSDDNVTVDGGVISLLTSKVNPGSTVTATVTDNAGQTSEPNSQKIAESVKPPTVTPDKTTGKVTITPPVDVDGMEISYIPTGESNTPVIVKTKKEGNAWKIEGKTPDGVEIKGETGIVTIKKGIAKEKSEVKAKSKKGNKESTESKGNVPDTTAPKAPEVKLQENGSITITPKNDPDTKTVEVEYNGPDGNKKTVKIKKEDSGWTKTEGDDGINVDGTSGTITIPKEKLYPGDKVTAIAKDEVGNSTDPVKDTAKPAPPTITADQGSGNVTIAPPTKGIVEGMIIKYKTPGDTPTDRTVTVKKGTDNKWKIDGDNPDGLTVVEGTGEVIIPKGKAKEKTPVTANSTVGKLQTPDKEAGQPPVLVPDKTAPSAPTVAVDEKTGNLTITPPSDEDTTSVTVTYKGNDGNDKTVTAKKDDQGKWKIENNTNGESADDHGLITIPKGKYNTGKEVVAYGNDDVNNQSEKRNATPVEVSFDGNTGTGSMDSKIVVVGKENKQQGQSAVVPAKFTLPECKFTAPDGKEFAGWLVGNGNEAKAVGTTIDVSANVTIKAKWKAKGTGTNPPGTGGSGTGGSTQDPSQPGTGTNPEPTPSNPEPGNPTQGSENPKDKPTDPAKNNPDPKDKPEDKKTGEDNKNNPKTPNVEKGDKVINVGDKEVVVPKVVVDKKKGKLDKEERTKIAEKIKQKNPDVVDVKIDEKANAYVTFNDGRRERIPAKDLVSKEGFVIPRRDRHSQDESPNRRRAGKNVKTGVESIAGIACTLVASTGALYIGRKKED